MIIRDMREADLPEVQELCKELGYPASLDQIKQRFALIIQNPLHLLAVADDDGRGVIGFVHASTSLALTDDIRAEIIGLVVSPKSRRAKVGSSLVRFVENWSIERGHARIRVRSQAMRETAHEFYKELGYDLKKIQNVFVKDLSH